MRHGDFDGKGIVDFDDYVLIDFSFNQHGGGNLVARAQSYLSDDRSLSGMDTTSLALATRTFRAVRH